MVLRRTPRERLRLQGAINDTSRRDGVSSRFRVENATGDLGEATRHAPTARREVEVPADGFIALVAEPDDPFACHTVWRL